MCFTVALNGACILICRLSSHRMQPAQQCTHLGCILEGALAGEVGRLHGEGRPGGVCFFLLVGGGGDEDSDSVLPLFLPVLPRPASVAAAFPTLKPIIAYLDGDRQGKEARHQEDGTAEMSHVVGVDQTTRFRKLRRQNASMSA